MFNRVLPWSAKAPLSHSFSYYFLHDWPVCCQKSGWERTTKGETNLQILINGILVKAKRREQKIFQAWQSGIEKKKEKGKRKMIIKVQKGQTFVCMIDNVQKTRDALTWLGGIRRFKTFFLRRSIQLSPRETSNLLSLFSLSCIPDAVRMQCVAQFSEVKTCNNSRPPEQVIARRSTRKKALYISCAKLSLVFSNHLLFNQFFIWNLFCQS